MLGRGNPLFFYGVAMSFEHLRRGDQVVKLMSSSEFPMALVVTAVQDGLVYCSPPGQDWPLHECWTFDVETGVEEDEYRGGGNKFGVTGSRLHGKTQ